MSCVNGTKDRLKIEENTQGMRTFMLSNIFLNDLNRSIYKKVNTHILLHSSYRKTFRVVFYQAITIQGSNTSYWLTLLIMEIKIVCNYNRFH